MKMNLLGKTALITGASRGLGKEFTKRLADLCFSSILVAKRLELMHNLQAEISARNEKPVELIQMDLAEP